MSEEQRKKFFYAEAEAGVYDGTIDLVVPFYRQAHETILRLAKQQFKEWRRNEAPNAPYYILDVGSGTGTEALGLCERIPNARIVALDLCEPMHQEFEKSFHARFQETARFSDIVTPLVGDIIGRESTPKAILAALPQKRRQQGFDLVVSSFVMHHLRHEDKLLAYKRIFDVLASNGAFINADLFSFHSGALSAEALKVDLDWIHSNFEERLVQTGISELQKAKLNKLKRRWLRHYRCDNIPEPIEDHYIDGKKSPGQLTLLRQIGFKDIACPFRYWQVGVFWAKKSA